MTIKRFYAYILLNLIAEGIVGRALIRLTVFLNHDVIDPDLECRVFIFADFEAEALEIRPGERKQNFTLILDIPVHAGIAEKLERNAVMLPFLGDFPEALGAELHLKGFAVALDAVIDKHEKGVLAPLVALDPELEDAVFEVRSEVHGTGDTDSDARIIIRDKFDLHGKRAFLGVLVSHDRFRVLARILICIPAPAGNGFPHHDRDYVLIGAERLSLLHYKPGCIAAPVIVKASEGYGR